MKSLEFIPFNRPDIGEEEIAEAVDTLKSGWLTTGPRTAAFEEEFRAYTESSHALAVNSCTAGLHLALAALDLQPGDEVITTPLTFCATINVILQVGTTPVLADVGPDMNIDPAAVRRAITPRTRAILPVHLAGLPCDMGAIWTLAGQHGLRVVEDAAHAVGAEYRGVRIGGTGFTAETQRAQRSDAVAFSFYATKNLCTGEGGMVTTPSAELADRMRILCLHGISHDAWNRYTEKGSWYYEVVECGFKYNMSDIMAAIGLVQLRRLETMQARRAEIALVYDDAFGEIAELELPPRRDDSKHAWHLYVLRLNLDELSIGRAEFIEEMKRRGIGCSVHFIPIPLHPYYKRVLEMRDPCSRALAEYPRLVSLPLYSKMTDHEVERVVWAVRDVVAKNKTGFTAETLRAQRS